MSATFNLFCCLLFLIIISFYGCGERQRIEYRSEKEEAHLLKQEQAESHLEEAQASLKEMGVTVGHLQVSGKGVTLPRRYFIKIDPEKAQEKMAQNNWTKDEWSINVQEKVKEINRIMKVIDINCAKKTYEDLVIFQRLTNRSDFWPRSLEQEALRRENGFKDLKDLEHKLASSLNDVKSNTSLVSWEDRLPDLLYNNQGRMTDLLMEMAFRASLYLHQYPELKGTLLAKELEKKRDLALSLLAKGPKNNGLVLTKPGKIITIKAPY